jgi:tetrapyrrole methylase family protein/MazG family protein
VEELKDRDLGELSSLLYIMERLRGPGGCPWDREQNHKSLRPYVLEEAYEVVEAIDGDSRRELKEELGDLLLQIVFHSQLGKEDGQFEISDVIRGICEKLIRRHPHVFSDVQADNADEVLRNWNAIKKREKGQNGNNSILSGVPKVLPALLKAVTYSKRAAQVGFDWDRTRDVIAKLKEEVSELEQSVMSGEKDAIEDEMGDVLFVMANLSRRLKVDPEVALERSNRKFRRRFSFIEDQLQAQGRSPQESNLEEMDELWNEAKKQESNLQES